MRTIVLSDCHIGSEEANYRKVNKFLRGLTCDRLVLLGDFWDLWDMPSDKIKNRYDDTVKLLDKLIDQGVDVKYLLGNHDEDYLDCPVMALSKVSVTPTCEITMPDGRRIALIHGHEFDPVFKRWYTLSRALAWINKTARKIFGLSAKSFRKKTCTDLEGQKFSDTVEKIHKKAKKTYAKFGYDGLIMGHTHAPTYEAMRGPSIDFYNAGDWKWSNTYIEINGNDIELRVFRE